MTHPAPVTSLGQLRAALDRSHELEELVDAAWNEAPLPVGSKVVVAAGLCSLALDHGRSLRVLLADVPPSAIALLRPQYEALLRATWAYQVAQDADLARLLAPLTEPSQHAAKRLPGIAEMLASLEKGGTPGAAALLGRARDRLGDSMNSFVHGGIHPFQRRQAGYPIPLLADVLKNSNGMTMLTLVVLAEISDDAVAGLIAGLHDEFEDVLPALEPFPS